MDKILQNNIIESLKEQDISLIAHYYAPKEIQIIAEMSGGFIGDSLEMAKFGQKSSSKNLIIAGVKFMGETAKILSPDKNVYMLDLEATCSLDIGCQPEEFKSFIEEHPDRTVVVYANTSAEIKAMADWVVTSSIAVDVIEHLQKKGEKILWAPDKHLGGYIKDKTGADMVLWNGSCIVHEEFKSRELKNIRNVYPNAAVLVHPESPKDVVEQADIIGSTSKLLNAVSSMDNSEFIIATDQGIFHKMAQNNPDKILILAPTAGVSVECKSCGHCPWMQMNTFDKIQSLLNEKSNSIQLNDDIIEKATLSLKRMIDFN